MFSLSTGNEWIDRGIAIVVVTIIILLGIMLMNMVCPAALQNVANNPEAADAVSETCSAFYQNAANMTSPP